MNSVLSVVNAFYKAPMLSSPVAIDSKLPWVGTTIFTVMSKLATDCGAINLSQGFPDFQADPSLFDAVHRAMLAGRNQYAPMAGMPELRQGIADKVAALYGMRYDVDSEITVTAGATQAIFTAIAAFVRPGDEVIVFEPVYDSYVPAIETVGGKAVYSRLLFPDYQPDWDHVKSLIGPRTRMIIVNTPNNPSCSLFSVEDMSVLAELTRDSDIVVLGDEVYEHICYEGEHQSLCRHPELAARSLVISSFGKTYHITRECARSDMHPINGSLWTHYLCGWGFEIYKRAFGRLPSRAADPRRRAAARRRVGAKPKGPTSSRLAGRAGRPMRSC